MIYIVRHGQTDWNLEKKIQGINDIPLNDTGRKQALEVKEKLSSVKFDLIFSSPLSRAVETAALITGRDDIIKDPRITEKGNGKFEGMYVEAANEIRSRPDYNEADYGVEQYSHLRARVAEFTDEIKRKYPGKNILIVTHAGTSVHFRCVFEGEPAGDSAYKMLQNGEIIRYEN